MRKVKAISFVLLMLPLCAMAETTDEGFFSIIYNKAAQYMRSKFSMSAEEKAELVKKIQTYTLQGNYGAAKSFLELYKYTFGEDTIYLTEKARLLALTNHCTEALVIVTKLLIKDPLNNTLIGIKYYALTHPDNQTSSPEAKQKLMDEYKSLVELYKKRLVENPDDKANVVRLLRTQTLLGNYAEAGKVLEAYKVKFADDEEFQIEEARYYSLSGQKQKALTIVDQLLKKSPRNSTFLDIKNFAMSLPSEEEMAVALAMNSADYAKAVHIYKEMLVKNPNDKNAALGLARALILQGKYPEAEKQLKIYEKTFGESVEYQIELARYYALTHKPKVALSITDKLLVKDPANKSLLDIKKFAIQVLNTKSKSGAQSALQLAQKLESQADRMRSNPELYAQAATAYLNTGDPNKALLMINKALALHSTSGAYLQLKADIYTRLGNKRAAYYLYRLIYGAMPENKEIILGFARAAGSYGKLDESADLYAIYNQRYPDEQQPWLEHAYIQSWRGNSRNAINLLQKYHSLFGDSEDYLVERARILASANRPIHSLEIIKPLLPVIPNNYSLNYANTVALYYNNQPVEMFQSLAKVKELAPDSPETLGLAAFITTPYRSNVSLDTYDSFDTDTVKIGRAIIAGQYYLSPTTSLLANLNIERLSASETSALNPIEGGHSMQLYRYNVGANCRYNSNITVQGIIGGADATDDENAFIYDFDALVRITEILKVDLQSKRNFYDVSARAVSLGVKQNLNQMVVFWQPCIQCYVNVQTAYSTFTDSNTMKLASINPSIQVISTESVNIRLGAYGQWYAFAEEFNHGYYNPLWYRYYSLSASAYAKYSDNIGYEFTWGVGTQKDNSFITYKPANDYSAKAYFGIYKDWYLTLSGGLSTRGRAIGNNPTLGTYRVYAFGATITRRI